eukprot:gene11276-biopygen7836
MAPEVGPAFQRRYRGPAFLKPWRPVGGNCVWCVESQKKFAIPALWSWIHVQNAQFCTFKMELCGANYPTISCFRAAIRTAARAKWDPMIRMASGSRPGAMLGGGVWWGPFPPYPRSPDPLPPPTQPQRKSTTSTLALDVQSPVSSNRLRTVPEPGGTR